ncbi:MAG: 2-dehydropantoate 2-reductase [Burkholderiales bacterium]|nr:2-dehydropantoate 2-reductase [Burkholderiales bacterium]MDE1929008.1 2-dehydropantoate 2-reductase [Burkholderiales bacterium]MDE2158535.1 2-dehydropantoate 2-reductase [Burkholderiales bacterium]MDE2503574.1 2-dehydropantoate 2-reductase [Burkholderiales bacterium]
MKVCIFGAGAIGGLIGTQLALAGRAEVSALARGATLAALRSRGWRMNKGGALLQAPARASDDAAELGPQDLVVIAVKAPALGGVAARLAPLLGPGTMVMPAMNGVPWWFCQGVEGFDRQPLQSVDPGGAIAAAIPLQRVVGCVVHASTSTPEPGLVQHQMGQGLIVGEARGGKSARVQAVAELLAQAGFEAMHTADVRGDIWYKLWGNMTMNPLSAVCGTTVDRVLADPLVRDFCSAAMAEAAAVGTRIGCRVRQTPEERHAVTAKLGAFKSSMLQDVEAGRAIELDAIVGAVQEIGRRVGVATPAIDALLGITRLFGRAHGLYPEAEPA